MTLRTKDDYLAQLSARTPSVVVAGAAVDGPLTEHHAFRGTAHSYSALFGLQNEAGAAEDLVTSQDDGPIATRFAIPITSEHIAKRGRAAALWAEASHGLLRNSPDHAASLITAFAGAAAWFEQIDGRFAESVREYHRFVAERDLTMSHALALPQVNRRPAGSDQLGGQMAARVVEHRDGGVVLAGARLLATSGPLSDEILVLPSTVLRGGAEESPYAFACAVPSDAPGVRFVTRAVAEDPKDPRDYPLSTRFDEVDAMVVFENVVVSPERLFLLGNAIKCNEIYRATGASPLLHQQVLERLAAKSSFYLALARELVESLGLSHRTWAQDAIAELFVEREAIRAALSASEHAAVESAWGTFEPASAPLDAARVRAAAAVGRGADIVADILGAGVLSAPGVQDLTGASADDVDLYYQGRSLSGPDRVRLTRLAIDASASEFSARQRAADRFTLGDPRALGAALVSRQGDEGSGDSISALLAARATTAS